MSTDIDNIISQKIRHILRHTTDGPAVMISPKTKMGGLTSQSTLESPRGRYGIVILGVLILLVMCGLIYILCS